ARGVASSSRSPVRPRAASPADTRDSPSPDGRDSGRRSRRWNRRARCRDLPSALPPARGRPGWPPRRPDPASRCRRASRTPYPRVRSRAALVNALGYGENRNMTRKATGKARLGEPTLTGSDWAEAALQLIAERGLHALTVSTLATRLGVTK